MKHTDVHPIEYMIVACMLLFEGLCWVINELAGFHSPPVMKPKTTPTKRLTTFASLMPKANVYTKRANPLFV